MTVQPVPDVPNWADQLSAWGQVGGAVATTAAVVVALWIATRERRWRRADHAVAEERRRAADAEKAAEQEERAASQARLVVSDCEVPFIGDETGAVETGFKLGPSAGAYGTIRLEHVVWVTITNGSTAPIFTPRVTWISSPIETITAMHLPYSSDTSSIDDTHPDVLRSGESVHIPVVCRGENEGGKLISIWFAAQAVISFADNNRRRWTRTGIALPVPVPVEPTTTE